MIKIFKKTKQLMFASQSSIFSSSALLAIMVIISRLVGFLRYRIYAGYFTKEQLDIFFAAFRIPDLIFEILITGALTTSFIPFFIKYQKNKEVQQVNISSIINMIILLLIAFILILSFLLPYVMPLITPGFSPEKIKQITQYSQILLVGQLPFFVLGNLLTGISQARKSFFIPAMAPILYNVAIIAVTLLLAQRFFLLAPVLGVIVGALLFFIVQIPILFFSDFEYKFIIKKTRILLDFFRLVIPRIMTVVVAQIEATIDLTLTTLLGSGAYTIFYFAQHLQLLPVSILGITVGQAALPYLTESYQDEDKEKFKNMIIGTILNIFFFTIPMMAYMVFARTPIVRFFFGGEKFDWDATVLTAVTLSYFALSIPFHSIYYFITRCFYAIFDSRTPFYVSIVSIFINLCLSLVFTLVLHLPVWALAISFSVSMTLNIIVLMGILYKKINGLDMKTLFIESIKIIIATAISAVITYSLQKLLDNLIFDTSRTINVFLLLVTTGGIYIGLYLFIAWLLNIKELYIISKMILKVKEYKRKIFEVYTEIQ